MRIAAASLAATGLYFYNYAYGFMVLLLLSLVHVLLEFPLNSISHRAARIEDRRGVDGRTKAAGAPTTPLGRSAAAARMAS